MAPKRDEESSPEADRRTLQNNPGSFKERIGHFTWSNYACTMSTGAIAAVLSQQPYTFKGLDVIAKIFFILDLVLFCAFSACMITRFYLFPWKLAKSLHFPNEALFFGSAWVSIALILNLIAKYGIPVCGLWLRIAMEVMFWMYSAFALLVAIFQYLTLFVANNMPVSAAMPALVFPVYPFLVIGPLAGVMLPNYSEGEGLPILIGGICFQGLGWTVAIFMYTIFIVRLLSSELPPPPKRPGMFISVGPAGYTSAGLIALGTRASVLIPHNFMSLGEFNTGATIKVLGVMGGIFLWLVAFWFFALSFVAILAGVREMSFTLNWWAMVFPNAGLTLALIQIGDVLDSPGIKAVTSGMSILLVIAWFFVAGAHISAAFRKQIYYEGCDEDDGMVPEDDDLVGEKKD